MQMQMGEPRRLAERKDIYYYYLVECVKAGRARFRHQDNQNSLELQLQRTRHKHEPRDNERPTILREDMRTSTHHTPTDGTAQTSVKQSKIRGDYVGVCVATRSQETRRGDACKCSK